MSVAQFNGKVTLNATGLADVSTTPGSKLTWTARFSFVDNAGKWLGTDVATGDLIALDTSGADLATVTSYIITAVSAKTFNSFNVTMEYSGSNGNPGGPPDVAVAVGLTGYVGSRTSNRGLALVSSPSTQLLSDTFAYQLTNDNNTNIVDLATNADGINGGAAGKVLYQAASGYTAFTAVGAAGQVLTSAGTGTPVWTTPSGSTATALTTARSISVTGDASWTVTFDGSANVTAALTLASTGVTSGTYRSVTVNAKGLVTGGTNPTTLAGYGITDALSSSNATSANTTNTIVSRDASGNFSAGTITASLNGTATLATNLAGGTAGALPYQSAISTTAFIAAGTSGYVLTSTGTATAPSWQAAPVATTAITQTAGNSSTLIATTAFVDRLRSSTLTSTTTTAALTDRGNTISLTAGITIPASVFASGDVFSVYNNSAAAVTLTSGAGLTLWLVGTATTGNRTLAQRGIATVYYISATEAVITGGGLT